MTEGSNPANDAGEEWLKSRRQSGNWLNIRPDEDIPPFVVGWDRTLVHMFQIAFTPEIDRRIKDDELPNGFFLQIAQLLQPPGGRQLVRFNDEVRGVMRLRRDKPMLEGEVLTVGDLERLEAFDLVEDELDSGHFTAFFTGSGWRSVFDFRQGRVKAGHFVGKAREFAAAARFSVEQRHSGAAIDNLFSACELLSKAQLMLSHHHAATNAKTHGPIGSAINAWAKLGNVDGEFVRLFNRLSGTRAQARYETAWVGELPKHADLELVDRMADQLELDVAARVS